MPRIAAVLVLLAGAGSSLAQAVSPAITYQGELRASGVSVVGPVDLRFSLYTAASGGSQIGGTIERLAVPLTGGKFSQELDFGAGAFGPNSRYLQIEVRNPAGAGSYTVLSPRQTVVAAPVAQYALNGNPGPQGPTGATGSQGPAGPQGASGTNGSNGATGPQGPAGATGVAGATGSQGPAGPQGLPGVPWSLNGATAYYNGGSVGIGTSTPGARFAVQGGVRVADVNDEDVDFFTGVFSVRNSHTSAQAYRYAYSPEQHDFFTGGLSRLTVAGNGNVGIGTGTPDTKLHALSSAGSAVHGQATGAGATSGVFGESSSTSGRGVYGSATATSGITYGGVFESASPNGRGVWGLNTATTGTAHGVIGQTASATGRGVFGWAYETTGVNYGVYGQSDSPSGYGVYGTSAANAGVRGVATATTGVNYGVLGESASGSGYGVYGLSADNAGVKGLANASTGANYGVFGESYSASGYGVYGTSADNVGVRGAATNIAGINYGVQGTSNSSGGYGVYGVASAASGFTHGGYFQASSTTGRAVEGASLATTGAGYGGYFFSNSPDGVGVYASSGGAAAGSSYGVYAISNSTTGQAVYGLATGSTGITNAVHAEAYSTSARAVQADCTATTGVNYGVYVTSQSTAGRGVYVQSMANTGVTYGLVGIVDSNDGVGVRGLVSSTASGSPRGVFGEVLGDAGYGVYGLGDSIGVAGRFNNAVGGFGVYSYGTLGSSGLKTFRIDHPDDPENKYLVHYSSEGPEPFNVYSGTVSVDALGNATVELPAYFAKVNRDPRYQLTAVGGPMPMLHIASEISPAALQSGAACSFRIGGGAPSGRVSWRLEAVRNDPYVRTYGAPVEVEKSPALRGTYQHPEFYGQPIERREDYKAPPADEPRTGATR